MRYHSRTCFIALTPIEFVSRFLEFFFSSTKIKTEKLVFLVQITQANHTSSRCYTTRWSGTKLTEKTLRFKKDSNPQPSAPILDQGIAALSLNH